MSLQLKPLMTHVQIFIIGTTFKSSTEDHILTVTKKLNCTLKVKQAAIAEA